MNPMLINLSSFSDRFEKNSLELRLTKNVNFIFGKNGTGKSTITNTIKEQYGNIANVKIFDGFEGIVGENHKLNAIALGTKNTKIQKEINIITDEINVLSKDIEKSDSTDNTYAKMDNANIQYNNKEKEINDFYSKAAKNIKNKKYDKVSISLPSYNKDTFYAEIGKAERLNEDEVEKCKKILKSEEKLVNAKIVFLDPNLSDLLKQVNGILSSCVSQSVVIDELENDSDKQNFAKEGFRIHKHVVGEKCAFCGNVISEERWQKLGKYFNQEVKNLEHRIELCINSIISQLTTLSSVKEIKSDDFFTQFSDRIVKINLQIKNIKIDYEKFFNFLKDSLEEKKKNLFSVSSELSITIPHSFSSISQEYESIATENNEFSHNLKREQDEAVNKLRYNEIAQEMENFKYTKEKENLSVLHTLLDNAKNEFDAKKAKVEKLKFDKNELLLQTQDESIISTKISKLLENMGVTSFSLELVNGDDEDQKGQYQIRGYDKKLRPIDNLSKGEKNIIAFLYFIFSLEKDNDDGKQHIIVLDDPMSSNDDTMQYLMIGEIQKYYRTINEDTILIILTHNCHFYFNVRPSTTAQYKENGKEVSFYEKYGNFHLFSNGKQTTIKNISKGKEDFCTNYEMLWKELVFLYEVNEPNLMLNACRKICETYMCFTKKNVNAFYNGNINAKKLFDVNQHSLNDLEAEQNGRTREQIIEILKALFESNNALEHFNNYCSVMKN